MFADMKAAYDMVDRDEMMKVIKKKELSHQLSEAIEDIYGETESRFTIEKVQNVCRKEKPNLKRQEIKNDGVIYKLI